MLERRKHNRYRVKNGLLAVVHQHSNPGGQVIGQVVDISVGGLAILCRKEDLRIGKDATLTMMYDNGRRHRIFPYRFDITPMSMMVSHPLKPAGTKEPKMICNIRFKVLTFYQENWIRQIVEEYTETVPEDGEALGPVPIKRSA